ncbi:hypothetical protein [Streptomyces griseoviridis]|uniref:ABC-type glycerol-3-phosphate transport system permease component n=1 Tax=Streptomyces griseoviridis TaxID=45398 RepID=A0ABT9LS06_STRGD|nr:hypothetical protein [Streptomyces griseoviridis]MDP9686324.1 ABC-type glycerol-3-phosphate transport system permease component [Streptomyces griseoviridis]GGT23149.1 hypothetical protein GCM10010240_64740 [Streptomyces griseoviridis]
MRVSTGVSGSGETITMMINCYVTQAGTPLTNLQTAASVMCVVPILLIFLVVQRGFVAGMSTTGLK